MAASIPREFHLDVCGSLVQLCRDADNPNLTILPNVRIRCYDHSRPALAVTSLRVEQFHPDNTAAAELRHADLRSEWLALLCIVRGGRSTLRADPIEVGCCERVVPGGQILQVGGSLPAVEYAGL